MRVFVYEFITAGGRLDPTSLGASTASLDREGAAMVQAITEDFDLMPGCEVWTLCDARRNPAWGSSSRVEFVDSYLTHELAFDRQVRAADVVLVIAPELDQILWKRCCRVVELERSLLGPSPGFIDLASDKCRTIEWLSAAGISVPFTMTCRTASELPAHLTFPAVIKPIDGAGSLGVARVDRNTIAQRLDGEHELCVQSFCPGRPASIAALGHRGGWIILPPCWQFVDEENFAYHGGAVIEDEDLVRRTRLIGLRALQAMPSTTGYVGVDLILGPADDGSQDRVLEINPRLTTSYIGLRHRTKDNLAAAMIACQQGLTPHLWFGDQSVQFAADGSVWVGEPQTGSPKVNAHRVNSVGRACR